MSGELVECQQSKIEIGQYFFSSEKILFHCKKTI